jgi:hypothetical protein
MVAALGKIELLLLLLLSFSSLQRTPVLILIDLPRAGMICVARSINTYSSQPNTKVFMALVMACNIHALRVVFRGGGSPLFCFYGEPFLRLAGTAVCSPVLYHTVRPGSRACIVCTGQSLYGNWRPDQSNEDVKQNCIDFIKGEGAMHPTNTLCTCVWRATFIVELVV